MVCRSPGDFDAPGSMRMRHFGQWCSTFLFIFFSSLKMRQKRKTRGLNRPTGTGSLNFQSLVSCWPLPTRKFKISSHRIQLCKKQKPSYRNPRLQSFGTSNLAGFQVDLWARQIRNFPPTPTDRSWRCKFVCLTNEILASAAAVDHKTKSLFPNSLPNCRWLFSLAAPKNLDLTT